jgi:HAD superfamily hydrolase (TIGR01509 family)
MSLKCVIFDMDGTLTQTNQLIFDSFNFIVQKYQGKTLTPQEITALFGPPEEGALIPIVGEERLPQAMDEYLSFYRFNHQRLAKLYPGILEVLNDVKKRGRHLALFTGKGIHTTTITLEEFGLKDLFDYVVTGNDVVNHKPSAEGIRKILDHFNLNPNEAVMVGDSVADVKASHAAGVKVAAVLWDSYAKDRVMKLETDYRFHSVTEFHHWLKAQLD